MSLTYTGSLTRSYASFFIDCGELALCPYLLTIRAFADSKYPNKTDLALGIGVCLFFSTIVPILPEIAAITFVIAGFVACVGLATMFLAYPLALLADAVDIALDIALDAYSTC